jgi:hypothetical protein
MASIARVVMMGRRMKSSAKFIVACPEQRKEEAKNQKSKGKMQKPIGERPGELGMFMGGYPGSAFCRGNAF